MAYGSSTPPTKCTVTLRVGLRAASTIRPAEAFRGRAPRTTLNASSQSLRRRRRFALCSFRKLAEQPRRPRRGGSTGRRAGRCHRDPPVDQGTAVPPSSGPAPAHRVPPRPHRRLAPRRQRPDLTRPSSRQTFQPGNSACRLAVRPPRPGAPLRFTPAPRTGLSFWASFVGYACPCSVVPLVSAAHVSLELCFKPLKSMSTSPSGRGPPLKDLRVVGLGLV